MKLLATEFTFGGFAFRQRMRDGAVALFEKSKPGHTEPSFEVVIVQTWPAEIRFGREYPEREAMPPNEAWGKAGWTHLTLEGAKTKFRTLVDAAQEG